MTNIRRLSHLSQKKILFPLLILALTSFTHLWNPIGFPAVHIDEGIYMFRAMHFLNNGNLNWDAQMYDHPYFGPIFLGTVLFVINFPGIITADIIQNGEFGLTYMIPRILMGVIAVVDTLLIYAITKIRYGTNAAFISSLLFSVMPLTWSIRRVYLESILLPFLLFAILLILYGGSLHNIENRTKPKPSIFRNKNLIVTVSGFVIGLAIFTKIPIVTMIPLLIYYIYRLNNKAKLVVLFIIPALLLPLIWPAYAIYNNEFDQWLNGIIIQINRENSAIPFAVYEMLSIDPILILISLVGIIFAIVRKDYFLILWVGPFILFFSLLIDYTNWFHLIPIIGAFCISSGVFIDWLIKKSSRWQLMTISVMTLVLLAGLISTVSVITTNVSAFQFQIFSYLQMDLLQDTKDSILLNSTRLPSFQTSSNYPAENQNVNIRSSDLMNHELNNSDSSSTTIVSSPIYSWVYRYIYYNNNTWTSYTNAESIQTDNVVLIVDRYFREYLTKDPENNTRMLYDDMQYSNEVSLGPLYLFEVYTALNSTMEFEGTAKNHDLDMYPFTSLRFNYGGSPVDIRTNL